MALDDKGRVLYVLGFAFDPKTGRVLLVQKSKPEWQAGRWNGIGGHIEVGEKKYSAMLREFQEETGRRVSYGWKHFGKLTMAQTENSPPGVVHLYTKVVEDLDQLVAPDGEDPIALHDPYDLPDNIISNLRWIVPMASAIAFKTGRTAQITVNAKYE
jgi:8-oxo-dGTP diphosphatase